VNVINLDKVELSHLYIDSIFNFDDHVFGKTSQNCFNILIMFCLSLGVQMLLNIFKNLVLRLQDILMFFTFLA
jgi:hypothetical protein